MVSTPQDKSGSARFGGKNNKEELSDATPAQRIAAVAILVLALVLGTVRHSISAAHRSNFHDLEFIEDSREADCGRYRILEFANTTGHRHWSAEATIRGPGGCKTSSFQADRPGALPEHSHLSQTELITVKEGVLGYTLDGVQGTLRPSDTPLSIPPGVQHTWWNADAGRRPVTLTLRVSPAGPGERSLEAIVGYLHDNGGAAKIPHLQYLVWLQASDAVPAPALYSAERWSMIVNFVVPVAKLLGYLPFHTEYHSHGAKVSHPVPQSTL